MDSDLALQEIAECYEYAQKLATELLAVSSKHGERVFFDLNDVDYFKEKKVVLKATLEKVKKDYSDPIAEIINLENARK